MNMIVKPFLALLCTISANIKLIQWLFKKYSETGNTYYYGQILEREIVERSRKENCSQFVYVINFLLKKVLNWNSLVKYSKLFFFMWIRCYSIVVPHTFGRIHFVLSLIKIIISFDGTVSTIHTQPEICVFLSYNPYFTMTICVVNRTFILCFVHNNVSWTILKPFTTQMAWSFFFYTSNAKITMGWVYSQGVCNA